MITLYLIYFILLLLLFIIYSSTRKFDYWKTLKIPYAKPLPFFGNIFEILTFKLTTSECLQNIYRNHKNDKYVGMFQLGTPTLLLRDPEVIKEFLIKDFEHFTDRGLTFDEHREPLTANLVNLEGLRWKTIRQKLTPTFTSGKIRNMTPLLHECTQQLHNYMDNIMDENLDIEIRELTAKFTTDVIGSCAFGLKFNALSETSSEFRSMGHRVLRPSKWTLLSKIIRIFFPTLFRLLNLRTFPYQVNKFFLSVVSDTLRHRETTNEHRHDFMQLLLEIKNSSNTKIEPDENNIVITDNLLAAQAFAFFLAGFETTSTTLSFCLHELAINPEVQLKVFKEIENVSSKYKSKSLDYDEIKELIYLEQCLLETMRKYPPVQTLNRICTKRYKIKDSGAVLEKGTPILVPIYAIHYDDKYYANPHEFNPDRFAKNNYKTDAYMPFGGGPRICIGMRFAVLQMKLALATFLNKFEVSICEKTTHPLILDPTTFFLAPKNGIWLNVKKR